MADAVVLDASAAVDLLTGGPGARQIDAALRGNALVAPSHMDAEVMSALERIWRAGQLGARVVDDALDFLETAPIRRYPVTPLLRRSWQLRDNVALRDAPYVLMAADIGVRLVTSDRRLARACVDQRLCRVADVSTQD